MVWTYVTKRKKILSGPMAATSGRDVLLKWFVELVFVGITIKTLLVGELKTPIQMPLLFALCAQQLQVYLV